MVEETQIDQENIEEIESQVESPDEAAVNLAGWKKALADYQNLQKDTERKMSQLNDFVLSSTVLELLPIFDNYEIALSHVPPEQKKESWVQGLEHTLKLWQNFLRDHKIERMVSVGKNFDPNQHEAISHIQDEKQADQVVVQEFLAGYSFQGSVIRAAKVAVNNLN